MVNKEPCNIKWIADKPTYGGWLNHVDVHLVVNFVNSLNRTEIRVAEVGVYLGAWSASVLMNCPSSKVFGIDPYPNMENIQNRMSKNLEELKVADRFFLYRDWSEVSNQEFDIIHIDGEHSEESVTRDLVFSKNKLSTDGLIIVDDIHHLWFPGVASSTFRFLEKHDFRIFALSKNKAYLARSEVASKLFFYWSDNLVDSGCFLSASEFTGKHYSQSTQVLGQKIIIYTQSKT